MKKLLKFFSKNKKTLLLAFGVVMILSFLPSYQAQAAWYDIFGNIFEYIATLPLKIAGLIVTLFLFVFSLAAAFLFFIVTNLLSWIKTICLIVPITHGGVVDVGWTFTRDFANMFFILILVFIGLATILRLKEYEVKKTLPLLLLIAILINFTPVIVGLIVDVSNIFTNFFLSHTGASVDSFVDVFNQGWTAIKTALESFAQFKDFNTVLGNIVGGVLFSIALLIFYGYATAVYCFVIFLLILRIAYLWVLMILAPLAFLSYIFPATKKLPLLGWDEWWKELIRWSIIGIPLGFFLYLSTWIMQNQPVIAGFFPSPAITDPNADFIFPAVMGGFAALLGSMIVPFVAMLILHLGTKMAKKLAPEMALQAIEGIKKGIKMAGSIALIAATGGAAAGLAAKGLGGLAKGAQGLEGLAERVPGVGGALKWGAKPVSWATRGINEVYGSQLREYEAKARRTPEGDLKNIDGMAATEAETYIDGKTSLLPEKIRRQRRAQYMAHMADKGSLKYTKFSGPTGEAARLANEICETENPYFQKEADTILNSTGGMTKKALIGSKLVSKTGAARTEARADIEKEIKETEEIMRKRNNINDLTIEVGLKLKYITKNEVDTNKIAALAKAQAEIATRGININEQISDIAAGATYRKTSKPEDIKDIIDPDNLADRVGLTLGNPRNLQRIQDSFGIKKFRAIIEGTGGLNDAMADKDKTKEFAEKINPQMSNAVFTSPAYKEVEVEGRKHMTGPDGKPTNNYDVFKRAVDIDKILHVPTNAPLVQLDADLKTEKLTEENINVSEEPLRKNEAERTKLEADAKRTEAEIKSLPNKIRERDAERRKLETDAKRTEAKRAKLETDAKKATGAARASLEKQAKEAEAERTNLEKQAKEAEAERTNLETEMKKAEAEKIKLEAEIKKIETDRISLKATIDPIVIGHKATLTTLQTKIASEKTAIAGNPDLKRNWDKLEELRK